jgi:hypothetical protein
MSKMDKEGLECSSVAEHILNMHTTLSLISSTVCVCVCVFIHCYEKDRLHRGHCRVPLDPLLQDRLSLPWISLPRSCPLSKVILPLRSLNA